MKKTPTLLLLMILCILILASCEYGYEDLDEKIGISGTLGDSRLYDPSAVTSFYPSGRIKPTETLPAETVPESIDVTSPEIPCISITVTDGFVSCNWSHLSSLVSRYWAVYSPGDPLNTSIAYPSSYYPIAYESPSGYLTVKTALSLIDGLPTVSEKWNLSDISKENKEHVHKLELEIIADEKAFTQYTLYFTNDGRMEIYESDGDYLCSLILNDSESSSEILETIIPRNEKDNSDIGSGLAAKLKAEYFLKLLREKSVYETVLSDLYISDYFGKYGEAEVVTFEGDSFCYTMMLRTVTLGNETITLPSGQIYYVYANDTLYTIEDAFNEGILSESDIHDLNLKIGLKSE